MPHPGLEPGPSDPESSALTTGPLTPQTVNTKSMLVCSEWIDSRPNKQKKVQMFSSLYMFRENALKTLVGERT